MADLTLKYVKCLDATDAYQTVANALAAAQEKIAAQIKQAAEIRYDEAKKQILLQGSGFQLQVSFLPQQLETNLELSLLLRPFRSKIIRAIEQEIAKVV